MIITKLQGGLGNQMFQYAIAYSYSKKVYIDFSFLKKHKSSNHQFTKRDFELSLFPRLKYYEFTESLRNLYFSNNRKYRLLRKFFRIKINIIRQKENEFISIEKSNNIYLDGFFQSEQYFLSKRKELLSVFKFPALDKNNEAIKNEIIAHSNSVSLHIRRGDYLKEEIKKYHGILAPQYYVSAIEIISNKYCYPHFFVFSEDETFADGLPEDEWIIENAEWLTDCFFDNAIPLDEANYRAFWKAINRQDWRCTSCAGCM